MLSSKVYNVLVESSRKDCCTCSACSSTMPRHRCLTKCLPKRPKSAQSHRTLSFQLANHSTLSWCFAFLDENELLALERVCRRWRSACRDGNASWLAAFQRRTIVDEAVLSNMSLRRLNPAMGFTSGSIEVSREVEKDNIPSVVASIASIPQLTDLKLNNSNLTNESWKAIKRMSRLQKLCLFQCDTNISGLSSLSSLTVLNVSGAMAWRGYNGTSHSEMKKCIQLASRLPKLREFSYSGSFRNLPKSAFPALHTLNANIDGADLPPLASFPQLRRLVREESGFTSFDGETMRGVTTITRICRCWAVHVSRMPSTCPT